MDVWIGHYLQVNIFGFKRNITFLYFVFYVNNIRLNKRIFKNTISFLTERYNTKMLFYTGECVTQYSSWQLIFFYYFTITNIIFYIYELFYDTIHIVYVDNNFDTSCFYFKLKLRDSNPNKPIILPIIYMAISITISIDYNWGNIKTWYYYLYTYTNTAVVLITIGWRITFNRSPKNTL